MDLDWKKALPYVAALATGNVPGLVAMAAKDLGDAIGTPIEPTVAGIDQTLKAATPEQLAALRQVEADLKVKLRGLDIEEKRIDADTTKAYISDVGEARKFNANTHGILILGYLINAASYACIAGVLAGCFWLLGGQRLNIDPGIAAMIGGIVGGCVQWLMSQTGQANGFFFGSSPSSRQVSTDLANAVKSGVAGAAR